MVPDVEEGTIFAGGDGEEILCVLFLLTRDRAPTDALRSTTTVPVAGLDREREREVLRTAPELGWTPTPTPPAEAPDAPPTIDGEKGEEGTTLLRSDGEPA